MAMETTATNSGMLELLRLDRAGFVPAPGMSRDEFVSNAEKILETHRRFDENLCTAGKADIFGVATVTPEERI